MWKLKVWFEFFLSSVFTSYHNVSSESPIPYPLCPRPAHLPVRHYPVMKVCRVTLFYRCQIWIQTQTERLFKPGGWIVRPHTGWQPNNVTVFVHHLVATISVDWCHQANRLSGFWSYQICFGVSVKQIHRGGVGFFFGRNAQPLDFPTAKSQTYIEGDLCASSGKEGNRKAIVTYMCGGFKIVAVSETSSCTYSLVVKIPEMCGAQGFPLVESKLSRGRKRHRRGITIRHTLHQN